MEIYDKLRKRLSEGNLPGEEAHNKMLVPGRKARAVDIKPNARVSAVLLVLYEQDGVLHFPLSLRPKYDGVHSAQMALPGGGREEQDQDLTDTAIRETFEEVGITIPRSQIVGQLSTFYIPPSNSLVTPFIGFATEKPHYKIDPNEVDRVIESTVSWIQDEQNLSSKTIALANGLKLEAPAYLVDNQIVWGATAMILSEFLHVLKESGYETNHHLTD